MVELAATYQYFAVAFAAMFLVSSFVLYRLVAAPREFWPRYLVAFAVGVAAFFAAVIFGPEVIPGVA